jgi:hypothetical protein
MKDCQRCGKPATRTTTGTGHACAVFYDKPEFFHCDECPVPESYLYPRTIRLEEKKGKEVNDPKLQ